MRIEFTVYGKPLGKQRHRDGNGKHYTPKQTEDRENLIKWSYKKECGNYRFPDKTPLDLRVYAYFPIPKSTSKLNRQKMIDGEIRPTVVPDYDNIAKIVSDALNGIAYDDDRCVVDSMQRKFYGEIPRTVIIIQEAKSPERSKQ